jgi:hypothetical protein
VLKRHDGRGEGCGWRSARAAVLFSPGRHRRALGAEWIGRQKGRISKMAYNLHSQSSTLTAEERSKEAIRLIALLDTIDDEELGTLTDRAQSFVNRLRLEASLLAEGAVLPISDAQLFWLRDLWAKFQ